jgi:hypothetical protein
MTNEDTSALIKWLLGNDVGLSSKAIARAAIGDEVCYADYPRDGGDLGRCFRLLHLCPSVRGGLNRLAQQSGPWKRLASRWSDLEAIHDAGDLSLHEIIKDITNPRGLRSYSWVKDDAGFWDIFDTQDGRKKTVEFGRGSIQFGD